LRAIADSYEELRESIETTLNAQALVGAPATWVLSNHDVTRPVTRYGREDTSSAFDAKRFGTPTDRRLGTRRARAAALLTAALPGRLYLWGNYAVDAQAVDPASMLSLCRAAIATRRSEPSGSGSDG
jgi:hypothetical protein